MPSEKVRSAYISVEVHISLYYTGFGLRMCKSGLLKGTGSRFNDYRKIDG